MDKQHFVLISLPAQSHFNPTLQLAKTLIHAGARATFATTEKGLGQMKHRPAMDGLSYASFSHGRNEGRNIPMTDPDYFKELNLFGSQSLKNLVSTLSNDGQKVTCLIYTLLLPWVAEVAREMHLPSAFLFIQSAASFSILYNFYQSKNGIHNDIENIKLVGSLVLPGLPMFKYSEIPTFLLPNSIMAPIFQQHIRTLEKDPNASVLINTFDALEEDAIKLINEASHIKVIPVGPLVDDYEKVKSSFRCELFSCSDRSDYIQWLDSKPERSVIYISFGSFVELQESEKEEIFQGLIQTGRPFLWALRDHGEDDEQVKGFKEKIGGGDGDDKRLIVGWCSQMEVLNHVAIGCFVTHCGWNSTVESMVAGVALVGYPRFSDQMVNMKMVEDVWGNGVSAVAMDVGGVVGREEIKRCVEVVMGGGERGEEMRKNAEKWKRLAIEAVKDGGPSHENLKQFQKVCNRWERDAP